jgi:hypothetical protein
MFSDKAIKVMEAVDKHVSDMNKKVKHPYFFTWDLPTNHIHEDVTDISYFSVNIGKYLIQETPENVERTIPVILSYFFGRINNLGKCTVPDNIADYWNSIFTRIIQKNYFALDCAARGFHNINNSEFMIDSPNDIKVNDV